MTAVSAPPPAALAPALQPVRFDLEPGATPSALPPVRIFLGTEPAQYRAERVFFYSLRRVRDPGRVYEVYRMTRLPGFAQGSWRTGFTSFRFAIPDLAGRHGRAIYNDVDQIYLADPGELFDLPMGDAGYLAITPADTAVMLLDCARMADVWTLERAQRLDKKALLNLAAATPGLWAALPARWHARDMEYQAGTTACLHYTALNLQPWHPTPEQYSYHPHPLGELWRDLERAAEAEGYEIFSAAAPSPAFAKAALQTLAAPRRVEPARLSGLCASPSIATAGPIDTGTMRAAAIHVRALGDSIQPQADLVASAGLEHYPADDLPWLIDALFVAARQAVYVAVQPSAAQEPANTEQWWRERLRAAARRHAGRVWQLDILDAAGRRTHGWRTLATSEVTARVWRLHGKHAGDNAQMDTLATALGAPGQSYQLHFNAESLRPDWIKRASRMGLDHSVPPLAPPWPDVVIAAGRRSSSVVRWIVAQSGGRTRSLMIGRPRAPLAAFDLVITTPQYGLPVRDNVLHLPAPPVPTAACDPHDLEHWRLRWAALPRPWIAVLAGGDRAPYRFDADAARRLAEAASSLATDLGGSVIAVTGPRTSEPAAAALAQALGEDAQCHRYGDGANPYRALLALADSFVVTGDSASMLAEAAATGKPVAAFPLPEQRKPIKRALRWLERRLGLVERAAGSRGTARQQNRLGRFYDRLVASGIVTRERDVAAVRQSLGIPALPARPAPALLGPELLVRAYADVAQQARDRLLIEQRID